MVELCVSAEQSSVKLSHVEKEIVAFVHECVYKDTTTSMLADDACERLLHFELLWLNNISFAL